MKTEPFTTEELHARIRKQLGVTQAETGKPEEIGSKTGKPILDALLSASESFTQAETNDWPSIDEQRKYWETHDIGGNVIPERIQANEDFYQTHRPFTEEEYREFGEFRSLNDREINDEDNEQ